MDDLLAAPRELIEPATSPSALDRLLRLRRVNQLPEREIAATQVKSCTAYEPGYIHVDLRYLHQMQEEAERVYLFVAIDRATR